MCSKKQTAGRDSLGEFAPFFAHLNDDVLFGESWARENVLSPKMRSILTVSALVSKGLIDQSFAYHAKTAKENGVTKSEMAEILTHLAFYAGWPNAWAAFRVVKDLYGDGDGFCPTFGLGSPNDAYAKYFTGKSYLNPLTDPGKTVFLANVTFEPGARNNWHIHHAASGGGQILLCTDGEGWYGEEGKEPRSLKPGDTVFIAPGVRHWHGAKKSSWFSHIAVECPGENTFNEWLSPVTDEEYPDGE